MSREGMLLLLDPEGSWALAVRGFYQAVGWALPPGLEVWRGISSFGGICFVALLPPPPGGPHDDPGEAGAVPACRPAGPIPRKPSHAQIRLHLGCGPQVILSMSVFLRQCQPSETVENRDTKLESGENRFFLPTTRGNFDAFCQFRTSKRMGGDTPLPHPGVEQECFR